VTGWGLVEKGEKSALKGTKGGTGNGCDLAGSEGTKGGGVVGTSKTRISVWGLPSLGMRGGVLAGDCTIKPRKMGGKKKK